MKQNPFDSILRWRDRQPGGEKPEDRAAALVRDSLQPGVLDSVLDSGLAPSQLASIEQNLRRGRWALRRPSLGLRLALVAMLLVAGVASVMAYEAARRAGWFAPRAPAQPSARTRPDKPEAKNGRPAPVHFEPSPVVAERALDLPSSVPEEVPVAESNRSRRQPRASHRESASGSPEPSPAATSDEILALDQAIGLLRRKHDASAALPALDAYLGRYPTGQLNREARLARVDALLMLQRSDEALVALETLPLDAHGRSTELQLIRAELRARTDCPRAEGDFSAVLTRGPNAALEERALYGRGACRVKRGDAKGAALDLRRYLDRFPTGAHAGWARRRLEGSDNSSTTGG
jgi:TolA-binding protein